MPMLTTSFKKFVIASIFGCASALPSLAAPKVVATIKPLNLLVEQVMGDVAKPQLLVEATQSPHDYTLKPSDAEALQDANVIFWVGPQLEKFLIKPLNSIAPDAQTIAMIDVDGMTLHEIREEEAFGDHEEAHSDEHDHDHDGHGDDDGHGHAHGAPGDTDPHIWLDPENANVMLGEIARVLAKADPENAEAYQQNATAAQEEINKLTTDIRTQLQPFKDASFIVFHDGFQYLEKRFGLSASGALTLSPEVPLSAARIKFIQGLMAKTGAKCVFAEPQFNEAKLNLIADKPVITVATIDPLGVKAATYGDLLGDIATQYAACLTPRDEK